MHAPVIFLQAVLLQAREPGFYMPDLPIYSITIALLFVTIIAFFWARGGGKSKKRTAAPPRARKKEAAASEDMEAYNTGRLNLPGEAGAPAPAAPEPEMAARAGGAGSILPWMTFAVSLFGTVSSFVLSLLTYLSAQS
ncbi:MAG: hypothetical protein PVI23_05920 [Maricaulaceae bacterium]|jgi:hypothetical protein